MRSRWSGVDEVWRGGCGRPTILTSCPQGRRLPSRAGVTAAMTDAWSGCCQVILSTLAYYVERWSGQLNSPADGWRNGCNCRAATRYPAPPEGNCVMFDQWPSKAAPPGGGRCMINVPFTTVYDGLCRRVKELSPSHRSTASILCCRLVGRDLPACVEAQSAGSGGMMSPPTVATPALAGAWPGPPRTRKAPPEPILCKASIWGSARGHRPDVPPCCFIKSPNPLAAPL
jgi:hypothetical protein